MSGTPEAITAGPAISIRDVVVSYDGRRVLDGINLDISRGETMVLLGAADPGRARFAPNNRIGKAAVRPDSRERFRSRQLHTQGSEKGAAFCWSRF